jgi:hypothetical protein
MRQADADDLLHVEHCVFGRTQGDVRQLLAWAEKPSSLAIVAEKHHRSAKAVTHFVVEQSVQGHGCFCW